MEAHAGDEAVAMEGASTVMLSPVHGVIYELSMFAGLEPLKVEKYSSASPLLRATPNP